MDHQTEVVLQVLKDIGINFVTGVPDSLMEGFCSSLDRRIENSFIHIPCANEGGAVAIAAGHYLTSKNVGLVYFQNSGLGNCVNPLTSLAHKDVYGIPMVLLIGWRGQHGVNDEPQHTVMGQITEEILGSMSIPLKILDNSTSVASIFQWARDTALNENKPVAILVKKGFFSKSKIKIQQIKNTELLTRGKAIETILENLSSNSIIVGTTGMIGRQIYAYREQYGQDKNKDFLNVGAMGHTLSIGIGMALSNKSSKIVVIDGDGSSLMHLGSLQVVTHNLNKLDNLTHIILNNHSHDSVGGQSTCNPDFDFSKFYRDTCPLENRNDFHHISDEQSLKRIIEEMNLKTRFNAIEVEISKSKDEDNVLPRPSMHPKDYKYDFIKQII